MILMQHMVYMVTVYDDDSEVTVITILELPLIYIEMATFSYTIWE